MEKLITFLNLNILESKKAVDDSDQICGWFKKEALDDLDDKDINYIFEYHKPANNRSTLTSWNECLLCLNIIIFELWTIIIF